MRWPAGGDDDNTTIFLVFLSFKSNKRKTENDTF